jgi:hypothetical protein
MIDQTTLTVLPRTDDKMPPWSAITKWCWSLGRMGHAPYGTWVPRFSIYNDGCGGPLYYVRGIPPFMKLTHTFMWEVLRSKSMEPHPVRGPGYVSGSPLPHIGVHFLGYSQELIASLLIRCGKVNLLSLPPSNLLHVVQTSEGLKTVIEPRHLHLTFHPQAPSRP